MDLFKYRLPNGNVFIWLGSGGIWGRSESVDNALILDGGDVLFLRTDKILPLYEPKVKEDIKNLSCEEFAKKYELPLNIDLWKELKNGIEMERYPPFLEKNEDRMKDLQNMISMYITNILNLIDPNEKIRQLEAIMQKCRNDIFRIRSEIKH